MPLELKMLRSAALILDQNDGGRALVVGRGMANGGGIDGVVTRMQLFPNGTVVVTVTKGTRAGNAVFYASRHVALRGDLEGEVMAEDERAERAESGWTLIETLVERRRRHR